MAFEIIEDCSPYYIRFTHVGMDDLISYCQDILSYSIQYDGNYGHIPLPEFRSRGILQRTPVAKCLPIDVNNIKLFVADPGSYYRAHKDGLINRFNINYGVSIKDDKCVTSWYTDQQLSQYKIDNLVTNNSRECDGFANDLHIPAKSVVARQSEGILFNTDIFHSWDNSQSSNRRVILTLKVVNEIKAGTYFENARKILFGL